MLCVNMELADKTLESTLDMTAAETAPNPMNDTPLGVRYCNTRGIVIWKYCLLGLPFASRGREYAV